MPKLSSSTLAIGATQFVVHEALDKMSCEAGSYASSLTPITIVMSSSLAGAEMMTFFAPASRCARAAGPVVNRPVDSITTSTPRSAQGRRPGSRSARILISWSPTRMTSPDTNTSNDRVPRTVSYLSRCAMVAMSPRSFAATISKPRSPSPALTARQKLRPIRPNPLIPTRIVTAHNLLVDPGDRAAAPRLSGSAGPGGTTPRDPLAPGGKPFPPDPLGRRSRPYQNIDPLTRTSG